jgi:ADP-dependent NAD(P)H-hydrate dehydratase / NAD(P)H-hydrate epimerase
MPVPVISVAQMREWEESTWGSGQTVEAVMRRAGQAVANRAQKMTAPGAEILVLAGKGNNGGDAKYGAEYLSERKVTLIDASDPVAARTRLSEKLPAARATDGLVIDGLFGIGLNRPLSVEWVRLITALNDGGVRILAIDIPSGLDSDTGVDYGAAVRAAATVTFGAPKVGMIQPQSVESVGRLEVAADIGLIPCPFAGDPQWTLTSDFSGFPPRRSAHGHKGTFGHLAILAGSQGFHGAAVIAARAAHRAMPGLVSAFTTTAAYPLVAGQLQQTMVHPWSAAAELPATTTAVLVGPGLAGPDIPQSLNDRVRELWEQSPLPVVADASALDSLPTGGDHPGIRIITPHPGEAARMLNATSNEVQADRLTAACRLSAKYGGCQVILKGSRTITCGEQGPAFLNSTGNAGLGQGGSGDALAGYLAGLVAQPLLQKDLDRLIRFAVWEHGHTADCLAAERFAWDLEDFIPRLGNSLQPA